MKVEITDNSGAFLDNLETKAEAALTAAGMFLMTESMLELGSDPRRIDTGNLLLSIHNEVDMGDKTVTVGTNEEYAIYVHEGTRRMVANRFIRNAFQNNADKIKRYIKSTLQGS
jgi:HK97 gp10 family phage protein